ncbi:unnamed protein product [Ectocarpus sp. 12 AP-2014]
MISFGSFDGETGTTHTATPVDDGESGKASGDTAEDEEPYQISFGSFGGQNGSLEGESVGEGGAVGEASEDTAEAEGKLDEAVGDGGIDSATAAGSMDGAASGQVENHGEGGGGGTALFLMELVLLFIGFLFTVLKKVVFTTGDAVVTIATTFSSNTTSDVITGAVKPVTSTISHYSSIGYTWLVRQRVQT